MKSLPHSRTAKTCQGRYTCWASNAVEVVNTQNRPGTMSQEAEIPGPSPGRVQ
ncbi:MAG: hypothetical protein M5U12_30725 [Verrucomicrobia bacterium]|nr:hypothetical protein [Verrucomicrobiota bacterium]